jgi:4-carboxymuconolactone decarboxylase
LKIGVENFNLAEAVAPLATHFHPPHHSLTQREREIAVRVITGKWHAPFSINAHAEIAVGLGVSPETAEALVCGRPASFYPREEIIYELTTSLADACWIPRSLYDRAVETLGHDRITDVLVLMGFYTAISLTLRFYDVPAGAPGMRR